MAFTGLSALTDGWHHPGSVGVTVCDAPNISAVVEVRPTIRATVPPEPVGPPGTPHITDASELYPKIVDSEGPTVSTGQDEPHIISAEDLVPIIVDTEED
jgi:hypothetical protein